MSTEQTTIDFRHGGFQVGDRVVWTNPYGIDRHLGEVVALHRNGNLCIRDRFGCTVDVHHAKTQRAEVVWSRDDFAARHIPDPA